MKEMKQPFNKAEFPVVVHRKGRHHCYSIQLPIEYTKTPAFIEIMAVPDQVMQRCEKEVQQALEIITDAILKDAFQGGKVAFFPASDMN